ncbi:MAG: cupin domain-containing protein [Pseudomonadota bacterium]
MLKAAPTGIIRFDVNGPDGLKPMALDAEDFHIVPDAQNLHVYFEDEELGLSVGIWDTTSMQEAFGPYPGDEFILVLEGAFQMMDSVDGSGTNVACKTGECVTFRNGAPLSWKQDGYLKKFYITYLDPRANTPQNVPADRAIQALGPELQLSDDDIDESASVKQRDKCYFMNDHGNFSMGLWDTEAMDTGMEAFPWHEFAYVRDGEVTITEETGIQHVFREGDVFFIPAGTVCRWQVPRYLRKFYATLDPTIRPGVVQ